MNLEDKDREIFTKGVHLFVMSKQNLLFVPGQEGFDGFMKCQKEAEDLFKTNFPDISREELDDISKNCFGIYYHLTNTPIMSLYTANRQMWGNFLNKTEE